MKINRTAEGRKGRKAEGQKGGTAEGAKGAKGINYKNSSPGTNKSAIGTVDFVARDFNS